MQRGSGTLARVGRVLVIDDDPLTGRAVSRALADAHQVSVLQSARAALRALDAGERFDVILCDMVMPDMDGKAFYEELEANAPGDAERVVFMVSTVPGLIGAWLARTPCVCLRKPLDPFVIREVTQELVKLAGEQRARGVR